MTSPTSEGQPWGTSAPPGQRPHRETSPLLNGIKINSPWGREAVLPVKVRDDVREEREERKTTGQRVPQPPRPAHQRPAALIGHFPQSDRRSSQSRHGWIEGGRAAVWGRSSAPARAGPRGGSERPSGKEAPQPAVPAAPVCHRTMEDVLPPGLLEICLLVGVPRERVRALLQVRGGSVRWGSVSAGLGVPAGSAPPWPGLSPSQEFD